jgi:hypothetical protein
VNWSPDELTRISAAVELEIAVRRPDGSFHRWTPIWAVCVDAEVFVRTWYRRDSGWYGQALRSRHARIRVPGLTTDVTVEDATSAQPNDINAAYEAKYGIPGAISMITPAAQATSLRLAPAHPDPGRESATVDG